MEADSRDQGGEQHRRVKARAEEVAQHLRGQPYILAAGRALDVPRGRRVDVADRQRRDGVVQRGNYGVDPLGVPRINSLVALECVTARATLQQAGGLGQYWLQRGLTHLHERGEVTSTVGERLRGRPRVGCQQVDAPGQRPEHLVPLRHSDGVFRKPTIADLQHHVRIDGQLEEVGSRPFRRDRPDRGHRTSPRLRQGHSKARQPDGDPHVLVARSVDGRDREPIEQRAPVVRGDERDDPSALQADAHARRGRCTRRWGDGHGGVGELTCHAEAPCGS